MAALPGGGEWAEGARRLGMENARLVQWWRTDFWVSREQGCLIRHSRWFEMPSCDPFPDSAGTSSVHVSWQ